MIAALFRFLDGLERVSRFIAALCLLAVMGIVFADVAARYLFRAPLIWSFDLIGIYLMPALFYLSLSDTLAAHHHVAVDLLRPRMPRWLIHFFEFAGSAAAAVVFLLILRIYWGSTAEKLHSDALILSSRQWPAWIADAFVVVGAATIALRLAGRAAGHLLSLVLGRDIVEPPSSVEV